jgi:hypothetical protein
MAPVSAPLFANLPPPASAPMANPSSVGPVTVIDATFTAGFLDEFTYDDDLFRGTTNPDYATAYVDTDMGHVTVELGGLDNSPAIGISGGGQRQFSLNETSDLAISITYQLEIGPIQDSTKFIQALLSIDGTLFGRNNTVDYIAQLNGTAGVGALLGFETVDVSVPAVSAGLHTLSIGAYTNRKDDNGETSWFRLDAVLVNAVPSTRRRV